MSIDPIHVFERAPDSIALPLPQVAAPLMHLDFLQHELQRASERGHPFATPSLLRGLLPEDAETRLRAVDWNSISLSLSFALVLRMIWVWDMRCRQIGELIHLVGDDDLYRCLHEALMTLMPRDDVPPVVAAAAGECIPATLPNHQSLGIRDRTFQMKITNRFLAFASKVLEASRSLGKPFRRTDADVLLHGFDQVLDTYRSHAADVILTSGRIAMGNYYGARRQSRKERIVARFARHRSQDLPTPEARAPGTGLSIALLAARRIDRIFAEVIRDDEMRSTAEQRAVFLIERRALLWALHSRDEYDNVAIRLFTLLPDSLTMETSTLVLPAYPLVAREGLLRAMEELRREAARLGEREEVLKGSFLPDTWYSMHQERRYDALITGTSSSICIPQIPEVEHDTPGDTDPVDQDEPSIPVTPRQPSSPGRPKAIIEYETAVQIWWDLSDDLAPRKPSQQDFCDRLAEMGVHIAARTLRQRISEWRRDGHVWPGPRPEAETAQT